MVEMTKQLSIRIAILLLFLFLFLELYCTEAQTPAPSPSFFPNMSEAVPASSASLPPPPEAVLNSSTLGNSNVPGKKFPPECKPVLTLDNLLNIEAGKKNPLLDNCSKALYAGVSTNVDNYTLQLGEHYRFCSQDPIADRNAAFDFSKNVTFLGQCFIDTNGSLLDRVCSIAEVKVYLKAIVQMATSASRTPSIVTKNCNDTTWSQGCESGWSSSLDASEVSSSNSMDSVASEYIPSRTSSPLPSCDGFFSPMGLTCMIPCPLGAYCPRGKLDNLTGLCSPYNYRLSGKNMSCGGADIWADVSTSGNVFCTAGHYCPVPNYRKSCDKGNYCRQGSIVKKKCFQMVSCNDEQSKQNIKAHGVLLLVSLTLTLLIFYNCSDQVMHIRDRRKAKVREKAVKQVRESLSAASEKWKKTAAAVRRMQRTFSRMRSLQLKPTQEMEVLAPPNILRSHELHHRDFSSPSVLLAVMDDKSPHHKNSKECDNKPISDPKRVSPLNKNIKPSEKDIYKPHDTPPKVPGVSSKNDNINPSKDDLYKPLDTPSIVLRTGCDKNQESVKRNILSSRSQIMRYAYNQIEKEKALQSKKASWEEILINSEHPLGRERLKIEIEFKDLSLILKGSQKKLLSGVTGKLSPGHVMAVMGPSGAGKTTFLNAIAGKAYNCKTTGHILINGSENPIHSYKKIIGFVPQDDIVHGSLTVEENLWFSANYRLPVDMAKADRVLVVERVIESLGLQQIRSLKVGTVENRGISGGERKRVNIGLEMVMEPSLFILDEPTSGLDSTCSQLVVRALRREASFGVNVSVVLHQPSYVLFKMFDDVMFLAKGGKTVYLGPVDGVESYFQSLNIIVPERINPPDYYMDVLEGDSNPCDEPNFDPKTLPTAWIKYKGCALPSSLQNSESQTDRLETEIESQSETGSESERADSFIQELWKEFKFYVSYRWDEFKSTFSIVGDNSRRKTPGFFQQFKLIFQRVAKQRFQEVNVQIQDYIILLLTGACLGALSPVKDSNLGSSGYFFTIIALSLLCMISSLRTFSNEKLQYWRESASGINRVAYFLAKDTVDHFNTLVKPLVYLSMFYFFNNPRSTFIENYIITVMLIYGVVGLAYIFSITMENGTAQLSYIVTIMFIHAIVAMVYIFSITMENGPAELWCVFFPIITTLLVTRAKSKRVLMYLSLLTFSYWAQEAYVIANAKRYSGVWLVTRCMVLKGGGYDLDHWYLCLGVLAAAGFLSRVIALLCLIFIKRNRQK